MYVCMRIYMIRSMAGAIAASAATFVGHYPWFVVYNYLSTSLLSAEQFVDLVHHGTHSCCVIFLLHIKCVNVCTVYTISRYSSQQILPRLLYSAMWM